MSVVKALRCLGNARTCSVIFQLLWRAARHDRGKEGRRAPSGESMSFRPKNAAGVRSGEISRATLQIHFHRSLSVVKVLRCLGNARTCSVIFQLLWRAARHDRGKEGRRAPSGESMSFRPKNAAGVRSGEISRATLQIHFYLNAAHLRRISRPLIGRPYRAPNGAYRVAAGNISTSTSALKNSPSRALTKPLPS